MGPKNSHLHPGNGMKGKHTFEEKVTKAQFEYMSIIGKGGFGKVWKVYSRKNKTQYALKEMSKAKIIDKRSEKSVKYERDLLSRMNHPFIVNMHYAFQDTDNLYIVMDLLTGGDLRYHICKEKKFTEEQAKFFIACIVLGLEYCHFNKVLHRDIKPENLVLDSKGYIKITDFGIAKIYQKENSCETSGTPGYMAPEVMCSQNHTIAVDYFALGVIGYEFMNGTRPYTGKSRKEIKEKIMARQAEVKKGEIPAGWSIESADFVNRLLQRKPSKRLGLFGATEVKEHSWFKYYPWRDLYLGKLISPFIPKAADNYDYKYCNKQDRIGLTTQERYMAIIGGSNYVSVFNDFYYFNREVEESENSKSNYQLRKFKNPHMVYYQEIEGNVSEKDSTICNRNILSNKSTEDEIYFEIKKKPNNTLFKLYSSGAIESARTVNHSLNNSRGSLKGDVTLNSSYSSRRHYATRVGYKY